MTNNYGWVWLDRDVSAEVMQIAVKSSPKHSCHRGDDPTIENFFADTRYSYDGGTMIRKWVVRDAIFKTKADYESFAKKVQNTTGTMRLEVQVASGVTSTNMEKFDGSNTTYEVRFMGFDDWERAGPGANTVRVIRRIMFQQG